MSLNHTRTCNPDDLRKRSHLSPTAAQRLLGTRGLTRCLAAIFQKSMQGVAKAKQLTSGLGKTNDKGFFRQENLLQIRIKFQISKKYVIISIFRSVVLGIVRLLIDECGAVVTQKSYGRAQRGLPVSHFVEKSQKSGVRNAVTMSKKLSNRNN